MHLRLGDPRKPCPETLICCRGCRLQRTAIAGHGGGFSMPSGEGLSAREVETYWGPACTYAMNFSQHCSGIETILRIIV